MPKDKRSGKVAATIRRDIHPHPGRRPELFVVVSHSPHVMNDWQISNLQRTERAAIDLIRRCDLARATIVRIPPEVGA